MEPRLSYVIAGARARLAAAGLESSDAALDADVLARHVLGWDRARLLTALRNPAPSGFAGRYLPLVCTLNATRVTDTFARLLGVNQPTFDRLALEAAPGSGGLVLVPHLDGEACVHDLRLYEIKELAKVADLVGDGQTVRARLARRVVPAGIEAIVGAAADVGGGLEVVTDRILHARDDDLDERREYDVAIHVSDLGGRLHLAIQRDDAPTPVELSSLKAPIAAIRAGLKALAEQWDYSRPMVEQPVFDTSMFTLAANGEALEQHLRKFLGDDIDRWERIHLLPFTNEFLPK